MRATAPGPRIFQLHRHWPYARAKRDAVCEIEYTLSYMHNSGVTGCDARNRVVMKLQSILPRLAVIAARPIIAGSSKDWLFHESKVKTLRAMDFARQGLWYEADCCCEVVGPHLRFVEASLGIHTGIPLAQGSVHKSAVLGN